MFLYMIYCFYIGGDNLANDQYILQSVDNTLQVIELLSQNTDIGVAEISRELGLGKATVFRILTTLENRNFVKKDGLAKYQLGVKFAFFGSIVQEQFDYVSEIRPFLIELRDTFNETAHTAMIDGENIVFVDKVLAKSTIQMSSKIGAKLPAYCTGTGKVLLAQKSFEEINKYLSEVELNELTRYTITSKEELKERLIKIKEDGYGSDIEESEVGLVCFAVPVYDYTNKVVLAISISGPAERMRQNKKPLIDKILDISKRASKKLGATIFD